MKRIYSKRKRRKYLKIIQGIVGILLLIVCLFNVHSVDAGTNDSVLLKNRMDGIYAIANLNGDVHLYYLDMYTMNGRASYCIDLGKKVTSDIYHSTSDFLISYLSDIQIEYIKSISYFGYQYPGHDDYRFYMAAQELIWEYLSGALVEWTNVMDIHGARIDIESFKTEILWLRDRFYSDLYFSGEENLIVDAGDEFILQGNAEILQFYEVTAYSNSNVWLDGNSLVVKTNDFYVGDSDVILTTNQAYTYESQLYYYEDSQRLISNGNLDQRTKHIWFRAKGSEVTIQLVDGDSKLPVAQGQASLEGAIYELYNSRGDFLQTFSTDVNGQAMLSNLVRDHYFIRQIGNSLGYMVNDTVVEFEVNQKQLEVTLEEYVITNVIKLLKIYGKNSDGRFGLENNIEFSIYDIDDHMYDSIFTNEMGIAVIQLPYGRYIFRQNNTTFGYSRVDDFEVDVEEVRTEEVWYNLVDSLVEVRLQVDSRDLGNKELILSNEFLYRIKNKKTDQYVEYDGEDVFATGDNGRVIFPFLLPYGDYILEQVAVPKGYILNQELLEFSINDQTPFEVIDDQLVTSLDYYNLFWLGKINILTNKEVFHTYSNGYEYEKKIRDHIGLNLVAKEDIFVGRNLKYSAGEIIQAVMTNEDGRSSLDNIYLGSYCLVEQESGLSSCFDFKDAVSVIEKDIELTILLEKTDVILSDTSESGEPIKGAVVEFYDQDKNLIYTGTTDENGGIKVEKLISGNYCFKQKRVPSGYLLRDEEICFQIVDTSSVKEVKLVNEHISSKWIRVPNTFSDKKNLGKFFILVMLGIGVICYQKICLHHH